MILNNVQKQKIKDATLSSYPCEMCGICTDDDFIQLDNVSDNPEKSFSIDPVQYAKVINTATCIVHSHCKNISEVETYDLRTPSQKDFISQKRSGKPWLIVGCEGHEVSDPIQLPRTPSPELLGRPFMWYINDCYTIVVDYYKYELGIDIKLHDNSFDWSQINTLSGVFDQHIKNYGFIDSSVDDLKNGDILIMSVRGMMHNHLGIYHNGNVIHQDGISVEVPYTSLQTRVNRVIRYAG